MELIKTKLEKKDYEKILMHANQLIKQSSIDLLVSTTTADMAREHIKNFPDDDSTQKKLDGKRDEVHPEVKQAMGR